MSDLADGESVEIQGSAAKPYLLKNTGGVYSCSCPAWRNQSIAIEQRTCKHLRKYRGDAAETERIGSALPQKPVRKVAGLSDGEDEPAGTEPPILLAEAWDNSLDLGGWWMSEKLDGVRAYWDGKQFLSRRNNVYHAPDWFRATRFALGWGMSSWRPNGSLRGSPRRRSTASCGWIARRFNGRSASCVGKTRTSSGRRSDIWSSTPRR